MSVPRPLSTSTPIRKDLYRSQTVVKTCSASETGHAELRSSTSHGCLRASTQPARFTNGPTVVRPVYAATKSDGQNQPSPGDKFSDYEELSSTPTLSAHLSPTPHVDPPAVYSSHTIPSSSRRSPCWVDPTKYQLPVRRHVEEPSRRSAGGSSPSVFRFDALRPPLSQRRDADVDDTRPSPIYAEPCDRLADGLRQKVVVRRVRGPTTTTTDVTTPPISATYKLPRDFLNVDSKRRAASDFQLLPDRKSARLSPQIVISPPSTVDQVEPEATPVVELSRVDAGGPQSTARQGGNRLKIRAAAAAVRRQRRSDYENVIDDDDFDDDQVQPSRRTTASSVRTEYSPPWDTDRWRFLVNPTLCTRQFCDCDTPTSEQREQVSYTQSLVEDFRMNVDDWIVDSCSFVSISS